MSDTPCAEPSEGLKERLSNLARVNPLRTLATGYAGYMLVTWLLLCLPLTHEQNDGSALDELFMAVSAVSTTGLVTIDTGGAYNWWGELVLLAAFQAGGLGYMTLGSFVVLAARRKLSATQEAIAGVCFTLPEGFEKASFIRHVVIFALVVETLGAAGFFFAFRNAGVDEPLWPAVFHSVSGFCTAGFSLFPNSLEDFRGDFRVNAAATFVSVCGAIGFLVASDLWLTLNGRRPRMTLTSRIILRMTFGSILLGTVLLLVFDNGLAALPRTERLLAAFFQSMTSLTTVGFNTHPLGTLGAASLAVITVLMVLGASPSGTGGGLKTTSVSAVFAVTASVLRGDRHVTYRGTEVPEFRVHQAVAAVVFYLSTAVIGCVLLLASETGEPESIVFEAVSALGTVGISTGVTGSLTTTGKLIVIGLMFIGRLGPLTVGLALLAARGAAPAAQEDLAV